MIVVTDTLMVNPRNVVYITKEVAYKGQFRVSLYGIGSDGRTNIGGCVFQNECEAELFMDYCCKEIDKANGIFEEKNEELNEENIC